MTDLTLPEVKPMPLSARFFKQGNKTLVELSGVGEKAPTNILKVTPSVMAQFKGEWDAFCDGRPMEKRPGTPLTDLPAIDEGRAEQLIRGNVHNLEELAALSDAHCQELGHGTLTHRTAARAIVARRSAEADSAMRKKVNDASAAIGPVPAEKYAGNSEVEALKAEMSELKQMLAAALAPKKRGPKKKAPE